MRRTVARSAKDAIDLIRANIKLYDIDCGFADANAYLFAQDDKQEKELESILNASREAGLDINYCDKIPVPRTFTAAVRAYGQAKFNPLPYVYAVGESF